MNKIFNWFKENWFRVGILFFILIIICIYLLNIFLSYFKQVSTINYSTPITKEALIDWQIGITNQLNSQTLSYIGIAIAIILALGGVLYLFTLKPFEKELERQAKDIKDTKESTQKTIEVDRNESKRELNDLSSQLKKDLLKIIDEKEIQIISRAQEENAINISKTREDLLNKINNLTKGISVIQARQLSQEKDISIAKTKNVTVEQGLKDELKNINIRLKVIETFKYSQEGKMGAILIPLEIISESNNTRGDWRIPEQLEILKKEVSGCSLGIEEKTKINEVLSKLPKKYDITLKEIFSILDKSK